jgi:hypothetical protein
MHMSCLASHEVVQARVQFGLWDMLGGGMGRVCGCRWRGTVQASFSRAASSHGKLLGAASGHGLHMRSLLLPAPFGRLGLGTFSYSIMTTTRIA